MVCVFPLFFFVVQLFLLCTFHCFICCVGVSEQSVGGGIRQSYHSSTSSSSLGSLERLEESGYSSTVNVHELYQGGYSVRHSRGVMWKELLYLE